MIFTQLTDIIITQMYKIREPASC